MKRRLLERFNQFEFSAVNGAESLSRSAVCIVLNAISEHELEVLMIQRAEREGDPWSGHMAFPGGRFDPELDQTVLETALRETREELSVDCDVVAQPLGRLSDVLTPQHIRRPLMSISPFVYYVHQRPSCDPNEEVAKVVWVPLAHFLNDGNRNVMNWVYDDRKVELPCYDYQGHRIWGLSLKMLDELLNLVK